MCRRNVAQLEFCHHYSGDSDRVKLSGKADSRMLFLAHKIQNRLCRNALKEAVGRWSARTLR